MVSLSTNLYMPGKLTTMEMQLMTKSNLTRQEARMGAYYKICRVLGMTDLEIRQMLIEDHEIILNISYVEFKIMHDSVCTPYLLN